MNELLLFHFRVTNVDLMNEKNPIYITVPITSFIISITWIFLSEYKLPKSWSKMTIYIFLIKKISNSLKDQFKSSSLPWDRWTVSSYELNFLILSPRWDNFVHINSSLKGSNLHFTYHDQVFLFVKNFLKSLILFDSKLIITCLRKQKIGNNWKL